ncbi:hypothetical protein [Bacillus siamensis]|nr:hypothetical protein [Bacillus siamensis]
MEVFTREFSISPAGAQTYYGILHASGFVLCAAAAFSPNYHVLRFCNV